MLNINQWVAFYGYNSRFKVLHADGRVSENNATGGPNLSAETELSWSVGAVYGNY